MEALADIYDRGIFDLELPLAGKAMGDGARIRVTSKSFHFNSLQTQTSNP